MNTDEQQELKNIAAYLHQKLKKRECDLFYFDGDILSFEEMIQEVAIQAQQLCWDDEIEFNDIHESQLDEWIDEYEIPEDGCSCDMGCSYCLGTEW